MAEEAKITPAEEVKETASETPAESAPAEEKKEEQTLGSLLGTEAKESKEEPKEEVKMIPEAKFLEIKKELKELKREMKGKTSIEISEDVGSFSEKYNLPKEFTEELSALISKENKKSVDEAISSRVKPFEEKEKAKKFEEIFSQTYEKALEEMPEYKSLANKETIKAIASNPANANKKFSEIFDMAYGHLVTGKRTLDRQITQKFDGEIDFARASRDGEYFKQIMSDPATKKKYNESLTQRNKF